jgi:hypothetical protein
VVTTVIVYLSVEVVPILKNCLVEPWRNRTAGAQ